MKKKFSDHLFSSDSFKKDISTKHWGKQMVITLLQLYNYIFMFFGICSEKHIWIIVMKQQIDWNEEQLYCLGLLSFETWILLTMIETNFESFFLLFGAMLRSSCSDTRPTNKLPFNRWFDKKLVICCIKWKKFTF